MRDLPRDEAVYAALEALRNNLVHSAAWARDADRLYELISELKHQKGEITNLERAAFRLGMVPVLAGSRAGRPTVRTRGGVTDWYARVVFLLPRQIREPWLGDLREDRMEMARKGAPRWWIEACTICQLLVLLGQILRGIVAEVADAARRLG